ncbi:MAG: threonine synthase [Chitinophagaceae bacterium]|nr:threonine synthase [Chitinophagaceae bacterium]
MKYFSTSHQAPLVSYKEAVIQGQPPDKGLYFPEYIPSFPSELINEPEKLSDEEIAFRVIKPYVAGSIPDEDLWTIVTETFCFPIPLRQVSLQAYTLELFHGPTMAFKDVGARFMSRCLRYFIKDINGRVVVLVATSGDTGGAVASGFYEVPGVEVVILYPSGKVSNVQEKQLTTLGKNIHALEVSGTFDDCQALVKTAFADKDLKQKLWLTSANSINISRWISQQIYYVLAWKQWPEKDNPPVISVPSGNLGNLSAGILAMLSGLPVSRFIAACNINDTVSHYLLTGERLHKKTMPTISNAMDVGNPSNFIRILELFSHQHSRVLQHLSAFTITDEQTRETIRETYEICHYLCDPHGAVGLAALNQFLRPHPGKKGIFLETAHPVKFPEEVEKITGHNIPLPPQVAQLMSLPKKSVPIAADYPSLKQFLLHL